MLDLHFFVSHHVPRTGPDGPSLRRELHHAVRLPTAAVPSATPHPTDDYRSDSQRLGLSIFPQKSSDCPPPTRSSTPKPPSNSPAKKRAPNESTCKIFVYLPPQRFSERTPQREAAQRNEKGNAVQICDNTRCCKFRPPVRHNTYLPAGQTRRYTLCHWFRMGPGRRRAGTSQKTCLSTMHR